MDLAIEVDVCDRITRWRYWLVLLAVSPLVSVGVSPRVHRGSNWLGVANVCVRWVWFATVLGYGCRTIPPKRILICDDEAVMRELVRVVLEGGYEFWEAADGVECVERARDLKPDLLIVDVMLPGRSGLEVLGELRADPDLARASVVVLTAWNHLEADVLNAGADAFVVKPFEPDLLRKIVADLLGRIDGCSGAGPTTSAE